MKRQFLALASAAAMIFGCTGCAVDAAQTAATTVPSASPTENAVPSPTVMSKEEALRIGVETYNALLAEEFEMLGTAGANIREFDALLTENMAEYRSTIVEHSQKGYEVHGSLELSNPQLQQFDASSITFYACVDLSKGWAVDANGNVVGGGRDGKIGSLEIRVVKSSDNSWRVDEKKKWDSTSRC